MDDSIFVGFRVGFWVFSYFDVFVAGAKYGAWIVVGIEKVNDSLGVGEGISQEIFDGLPEVGIEHYGGRIDGSVENNARLIAGDVEPGEGLGCLEGAEVGVVEGSWGRSWGGQG